ncbi:MAG: sigma-70 family RNA polymerase sigma factor [Eubacteriales bacterium]|nr:sigma-70 family RNA polymerase sigma factor [Eubacteriales bacterium]
MEEIIDRAKKGDKDAFVEIINMNRLSMYRVAKSYLKCDEDVADVISEAIITAYEKINQLKESKYFNTWLIRILINKCNYYIKKNKKYIYTEGAELENADNDAHIFLENDDRYEHVEELSTIMGYNDKALHKEVYRTKLKPDNYVDLNIYGQEIKINLLKQKLYDDGETNSVYRSEDGTLEAYPLGNSGHALYFKRNNSEFEYFNTQSFINLISGNKDIGERDYINIDDIIILCKDNLTFDKVRTKSIYTMDFEENGEFTGGTFELPIPEINNEIIVDKEVVLGVKNGKKHMAYIYKVENSGSRYRIYANIELIDKYDCMAGIMVCPETDLAEDIMGQYGCFNGTIDGKKYIVIEISAKYKEFTEYTKNVGKIKFHCDSYSIDMDETIELE